VGVQDVVRSPATAPLPTPTPDPPTPRRPRSRRPSNTPGRTPPEGDHHGDDRHVSVQRLLDGDSKTQTALADWTPAQLLLVACVLAPTPTRPSPRHGVTGHGVTYTQIAAAPSDALDHAQSVHLVASAGASPTSTACVATWTTNRTGGGIIEFEVTNWFGATASAAVLQYPSATGTATSHTATNLLNAAGWAATWPSPSGCTWPTRARRPAGASGRRPSTATSRAPTRASRRRRRRVMTARRPRRGRRAVRIGHCARTPDVSADLRLGL